jgi:hypothetical protein
MLDNANDDNYDNEENVQAEESRLMAVMANNLRIYPC